MRHKMLKIALLIAVCFAFGSELITVCYAFDSNESFVQCGVPGTPPCPSKPKPTTKRTPKPALKPVTKQIPKPLPKKSSNQNSSRNERTTNDSRRVIETDRTETSELWEGQETPLALEQILVALKDPRNRASKIIRRGNKKLEEKVTELGVTFILTSEIETKLKTAGASVDLLSAIRIASEKNSAKVLFEERFNNNNRQWNSKLDDGAFRSDVLDYKLIVERKSATGFHHLTASVELNQNKNFIIEVTLNKIAGVDDFGYGLVWGGKDFSNYYTFVIFGDGGFRVLRVIDDKQYDIVPYRSSDAVNKFKSTNKLTIEKKDDILRFNINGQLVGSAKFEPLFGNKTGFIVYNQQTIGFDDFFVTEINKP